jgi:hypothetical protein
MTTITSAASRAIHRSGRIRCNGIVIVIVIRAQHEHSTGQEHHGHRDLHDLVREQAEQAAARDRQHHVHRERRCRPGEHSARPVPRAQHQARQPRIVRQFGKQDRPENNPGDQQTRHVITSQLAQPRRPGAGTWGYGGMTRGHATPPHHAGMAN